MNKEDLKKATITFAGPVGKPVVFNIENISNEGEINFTAHLDNPENESVEDGGIHMALAQVFEEMLQAVRLRIVEITPEELKQEGKVINFPMSNGAEA